MKHEFVLRKMPVRPADPVAYFLDMDDDFLALNPLIGRKFRFEHTGYQCLSCGSDEPIYARGFCKKCFFEAPEAGRWFIHPEESKAHLGIEDRDLAYEQAVQLAPHVVYLAKTSDVKVGVTRRSQIPVRWIDQGADEAMIIAETPNRYLAGVAEVALKPYVKDKTSWRGMLRSRGGGADLEEIFRQLLPHLPEEVRPYVVKERKIYRFNYPVERMPELKSAYSFKKNKVIEGRLAGIKGQYLIFDDGHVLNIRNHEGYVVRLEVE